MKDKYRTRLAKIEAKIKSLQAQETAEQVTLEQYYNFGFWDFFDWNHMYSDEKVSNYLHSKEEIRLRYENDINIVSAEWAALFLIATNIAHKNRPLHGDTATRKLKKHGKNGEKVIIQIEKSCYLPMLINGRAYLHSALYKKYGVKLLDENHARYLISQIKNVEQYIAKTQDKSLQKQLDKYTKELNMFHKSIRDKIIRENTEQEFAF